MKKYTIPILAGIIIILTMVIFFKNQAVFGGETLVTINSGGTSTSTPPAYGQILIGNLTGTGWDYVASSTFGGGTSYTTFNNDFDTRLSATTTLFNITTLLGLQNASSTKFSSTYASSTSGYFGSLSVLGTLTGNLTGNADTATALASNPTDCGANTWGNAIAASGNLTCSAITYNGITAMTSANFNTLISDNTGTGLAVFDTSPTLITPILGYASSTQLTVSSNSYLATVSTGVWNGTAVGVGFGGTGLTSATAGYFLVGLSATSLQATSTMFITPTGSVGIATTTPSTAYKLDVYGQTRLDNTSATASTTIRGNTEFRSTDLTKGCYFKYQTATTSLICF